jgi:hypothetical protein
MTSGPNRLADRLRDGIEDANAELEDCRDRNRRSELNKEVHRMKGLLRWCETRAGYVCEEADRTQVKRN